MTDPDDPRLADEKAAAQAQVDTEPSDGETPHRWQDVKDVLGVTDEDRALDESADRAFTPPSAEDEGSETAESAAEGLRMDDQPFTGPTTEAEAEALVEEDAASAGPSGPPTSTPQAEMPTAESTPTEVTSTPPQAEASTPTVEASAPTVEAAAPKTEAAPTVEAVVPLSAGLVKLVIEQGLSLGKEFLVSDEEMLIGRRDPEQDFIPDIDLFDQESPNNRYISRRQARLWFQEGGLWLEDLDSSNGTALNNHMIRPHEKKRLKPGDKLLLGQSVLLRVRAIAG